jgi:hypothetical protein
MSIATISYAGRENSRRGRINIAERGRKLSGCGGREEDGTSTHGRPPVGANVEKLSVFRHMSNETIPRTWLCCYKE